MLHLDARKATSFNRTSKRKLRLVIIVSVCLREILCVASIYIYCDSLTGFWGVGFLHPLYNQKFPVHVNSTFFFIIDGASGCARVWNPFQLLRASDTCKPQEVNALCYGLLLVGLCVLVVSDAA